VVASCDFLVHFLKNLSFENERSPLAFATIIERKIRIAISTFGKIEEIFSLYI
jgi:preprotein translocase subunit SecB